MQYANQVLILDHGSSIFRSTPCSVWACNICRQECLPN